MSLAQRRGMADREHPSLSTARQCGPGGSGPFQPVLSAQGALRREPGLDAGDGPPAPGYTLLRVEAHEGLAGAGGQAGEPEAGAAADAHHGVAGHLPESPHQPACAGAPGLSLSVGTRSELPGPTRRGPPTSPPYPWPGDSSTWWSSWTGTAGTWWPGDCPTACVWGGRAKVRAALYMGALVATRYNSALRRFYKCLLRPASRKSWR